MRSWGGASGSRRRRRRRGGRGGGDGVLRAFDVKTGEVLAGPPPRPLDELQVEIRDSAVFVNYRDYRLGVSDKIEA